MKLSQDEVFEWACGMDRKYGCHPLRAIGMLDTYLCVSNYDHQKACKKIEKILEDEKNGKQKTKDAKRYC